jgi:membrane-associated phospholipid phosphatase
MNTSQRIYLGKDLIIRNDNNDLKSKTPLFFRIFMTHMDLFQQIIRGDFYLFEHINGEWTGDFLDNFFLFIRQAPVWAPFYVFLLVFVTWNFKARGWWWCAFFLLCVSFTDILSSHIIKNVVGRLRPCMEPLLAQQVRFIANYCPHSGSFTSSHAANHFGMAAFIVGTLGKQSGQWKWVYLWAGLIAYAQVYVGVHYPLDIAGGTVLGLLIGTYLARFYNQKIGPLLFTNLSPA